MVTDTEALRAQFERKISEVTLFPVQRHGDSYIHRICALAWECYQAGYAAAKAETADAVAGRWYFVANDGAATLCADEADARESAAEADIAFPRMAPHRAVQLVPADQLAAAVAAERERAARVCERIADDYNQREGLKCAELTTDAETGANECADAIRAGAKEPRDD